MIHVFYHGSCFDGFCAAWVCNKMFGDNANYHPVSYGFPPPEKDKDNNLISGDILCIVDFSYPEEILLKLHERFERIIILDHHKTAEEMLGKIKDKYDWLEIYFDMKRSGALMTWNHFFPDDSPPDLVQYISDRDLWEFKMKETKQVHKALVSYPMNFDVWDSFCIEDLKKAGVACERIHNQLVNNICKNFWMKKIDGQVVPVVNTSIAWSEVGHQLLENHSDAPFVASFTIFEDQVMWSLRSRSGSDVDVSAIAKKFAGGGHRHASGFKTQRF